MPGRQICDCKAEEITTKNGRLPAQLVNKSIEDWAENKLRVELRLLHKELEKINFTRGKDFQVTKIPRIFNEYLGKIQMTEQIRLTDEITARLPNKLISTYTLWTEGHDLRSMMSKATYYRQRKALMEYGINIDLRPCEPATTNVVPYIGSKTSNHSRMGIFKSIDSFICNTSLIQLLRNARYKAITNWSAALNEPLRS